MAAAPSAPPAVAEAPAPLPPAVQEVVDRLSAQLKSAFHSGHALPPSHLNVEPLDAACPLADSIRAHNAAVDVLASDQAALESGVLNLARAMVGDADGDAIAATAHELRTSRYDQAKGRVDILIRKARLTADLAAHLERTDLAAAEADLAKLRADAAAALTAIGHGPETQLADAASPDSKAAVFAQLVNRTPKVRDAIGHFDELKARVAHLREEISAVHRSHLNAARAALVKAWHDLVGCIVP
jgi:hypothetical protein